jgi:hypothetical protein
MVPGTYFVVVSVICCRTLSYALYFRIASVKHSLKQRWAGIHSYIFVVSLFSISTVFIVVDRFVSPERKGRPGVFREVSSEDLSI